MSEIEIFEPAMCCSTGVCGPGVDKELLRVATFINQLEGEGKKVIRYNLSSTPQAFIENKHVNDALASEGADILPITYVDGEIKQVGSYPTNFDLASWAGMTRQELFGMIRKNREVSGGGCCTGGGCC